MSFRTLMRCLRILQSECLLTEVGTRYKSNRYIAYVIGMTIPSRCFDRNEFTVITTDFNHTFMEHCLISQTTKGVYDGGPLVISVMRKAVHIQRTVRFIGNRCAMRAARNKSAPVLPSRGHKPIMHLLALA